MYRCAAHPAHAPTSEVYLVLRAGNVLDVETHTALVRRSTSPRRRCRSVGDGLRARRRRGRLSANSRARTPETIERSGCAVVDDDLLLSRAGTAARRGRRRSFQAMARAFVTSTIPTATMYSVARAAGRRSWTACAPRARGRIFAAPSSARRRSSTSRCSSTRSEGGIPSNRFKYARKHGPSSADPRARPERRRRMKL